MPTYEFETIFCPIPINDWSKVNEALGFSLNRSKIVPSVFELIGVLRRIEGVRSIVFIYNSGLPMYTTLFFLITSLIEGSTNLIVGGGSISITTRITCG